jgi:polynucleotide 5'-hydroxyl-kinase GRC3/NOL9
VTEPPAAALEAAAAARVTLVLGANDTGKSTLVARLAAALVRDGHTVAVVDADLGQSDIGLPTAVGLGRVGRPIDRLDEVEVAALEFLGVTSPATCLRETADATARLVARALGEGCDRVLVDTSGLVQGDLGRALKRMKIDRVRPDVVIALERAAECEPILGAYAAGGPPAIVRLPAARTTPRSAATRRQQRLRALAAHLAGAVPVTVDLARVPARAAPTRRGLAVIDVEGVLVGLDDHAGRTRVLGWVRAVDARKARLTIETAVDGETIAAVTIGRERYPAA